MAIFAMMWGGGAARESTAQTRSETPDEHARPGHQMNGPSDGAFHHRFEDAEKWAKEFDNPERDAWQKPDEILDALHLQRNSLVADIGAGTGYFSVRIAKRIPEGKIFAADIEPDMVRYLGERARREQFDQPRAGAGKRRRGQSPRAGRCCARRGHLSPHRQPNPIFRQTEIIAAACWTTSDRRF